MHPIALQFGDFALRWYGVMAAIGFLTATFVITRNRKYADMTSDQASGIVFLAMISGIVGARIFYVIQFFDSYRHDFWGMFRVDRGGLVFYGGFFLALITVLIACRVWKLAVPAVLDVCAPALAIGHAAGRIGCFLNGCCFGKPTECFTGVVHPEGSTPFLRYGAMPLHPVQLYEAAINIALFFLLFYLVRKTHRGVTTGVYLTVYGLIRFADEFFRGDHRQFWNGMTPAQTIGLLLVPAGIIILTLAIRHGKRSDKNA